MMNLDDLSIQTQPSETPEGSAPSSKKALQFFGWGLFALISLLFFTILKLPEERIKGYIDQTLSTLLAPRGMTLQSEDSQLSLIFGPEYIMKKVTLTSSPPTQSVKLDELTLSPALLPIFIGKWGGTAQLKQGQGSLKISGSLRDHQSFIQLDGKQMNLGSSGLLPLALGVQASGIFEGQGKMNLDLEDLTSLEGHLQGQLTQVSLDSQIIAGFRIPKLTLSEARFDLKAEKSKLFISSIKLGQPGHAQDDIQAQISGEVTLGKTLESSTLNLKVKFSLSENVLRSFVILDAILGSGKQPDGSYQFTLKGPALSPIPTPGE